MTGGRGSAPSFGGGTAFEEDGTTTTTTTTSTTSNTLVQPSHQNHQHVASQQLPQAQSVETSASGIPSQQLPQAQSTPASGIPSGDIGAGRASPFDEKRTFPPMPPPPPTPTPPVLTGSGLPAKQPQPDTQSNTALPVASKSLPPAPKAPLNTPSTPPAAKLTQTAATSTKKLTAPLPLITEYPRSALALLIRAAQDNRVCPFVGAGVSMHTLPGQPLSRATCWLFSVS